MTRGLRCALFAALTWALAACGHFQTTPVGPWQHPMFLSQREALIQAVDRHSLRAGWHKDRTHSTSENNRIMFRPSHGGTEYAIYLRFVESNDKQPRTIVYASCVPTNQWAGYRTCRNLIASVLRTMATVAPTEEKYSWQTP